MPVYQLSSQVRNFRLVCNHPDCNFQGEKPGIVVGVTQADYDLMISSLNPQHIFTATSVFDVNVAVFFSTKIPIF